MKLKFWSLTALAVSVLTKEISRDKRHSVSFSMYLRTQILDSRISKAPGFPCSSEGTLFKPFHPMGKS